jgi:hypothetical protein
LSVLVLCAVVGCAGQKASREEPAVELRVLDSSSVRVGDPQVDVRNAIAKRTEQFGAAGGMVGAGAGCVAGGAGSVVLMVYTGGVDPTGAIVAGGCVLGGLVVMPFGWALGAGVGVAAGTAEGLIAELIYVSQPLETKAVEDAFEALDISAALRATLVAGFIRSETPITLLNDGFDEEDEGLPLPEMVLVVKVTELAMEFPGWLSSSAALRLSAQGVAHAPGKPLPSVVVGNWSARSRWTDLEQLLAAPPREIQRMSEQALSGLADEIIDDLNDEIAAIQASLAERSRDGAGQDAPQEASQDAPLSVPHAPSHRERPWERLFPKL